MTVEPGTASDADVTVRGDGREVLGVFDGRLPLSRVRVSGDRKALARLLAG